MRMASITVMKRLHIRVGGVVQGVCFRYHAVREAGRIGVTGWVRNTPDGRVEAVVEGEDSCVEAMAGWFRHGPPDAAVEEFHSSEEPFRGEFEGFRVVACGG
jgi:acylphosphatase